MTAPELVAESLRLQALREVAMKEWRRLDELIIAIEAVRINGAMESSQRAKERIGAYRAKGASNEQTGRVARQR